MIIIISNNKNNYYNSNNNNVEDGKNNRLKNKWTLTLITNWFGLLGVWRIQALHDKQFKITAGKKETKKRKKKKSKAIWYITPAMGYNPRNE